VEATVKPTPPLSVQEMTAAALICVAIVFGVSSVFVRYPAVTGAGGLALVAFLVLSYRRLGLIALVPLWISTLAFAGAIWRGVCPRP